MTTAPARLEHKISTAPFELKDGEEGSFTATFSLFNVIDADADVTLNGAFTDGIEVPLAAWGHDWGSPAIGKGIIHTDSQRAQIVGRFFTETTHGRDAYLTVKGMGAAQQWSYGFNVIDSERGTFAGKSVRFLKRLFVHEVSPVLVGAQSRTSTDSIKAAGHHHSGADAGCAFCVTLARYRKLQDIYGTPVLRPRGW